MRQNKSIKISNDQEVLAFLPQVRQAYPGHRLTVTWQSGGDLINLFIDRYDTLLEMTRRVREGDADAADVYLRWIEESNNRAAVFSIRNVTLRKAVQCALEASEIKMKNLETLDPLCEEHDECQRQRQGIMPECSGICLLAHPECKE